MSTPGTPVNATPGTPGTPGTMTTTPFRSPSAYRQEQEQAERETEGRTDLLLRFFHSEFFDEWIAVSYLWRTRAEGVRDYLCNRMYTLDEHGIEKYMAQIVVLAVSRPSAALDRLVVDLCRRSLRLACKITWWLQAYENDGRAAPEALKMLRRKCEEVALQNGKWPITSCFKAAVLANSPQLDPNPSATQDLPSPRLRRGTFEGTMELVKELCQASATLAKAFPADDRQGTLRSILARCSAQIESRPAGQGLWFPVGKDTSRILRLASEEAVLLNSREKAPYLLLVEVLLPQKGDSGDGAQAVMNGTAGENGTPGARESLTGKTTLDAALAKVTRGLVRVQLTFDSKRPEAPIRVGIEVCKINKGASKDHEKHKSPHQRVPSDKGLADMAARIGVPDASPPSPSSSGPSAASPSAAPRAAGPFGEKWSDKVERIRKSSAYGALPGWALKAVIVKSGDDCRQEHMAVQIISALHGIFQEAGLPLWLRPFEVLVTSSHSAFIEAISNAPSVHSVKTRAPHGSSLRDTFIARYGADTAAFRTAQRNFVESMAGYSIMGYLFQLKDRHNGNVLLDDEGHIIHIDFSFMLSYSPGGINFETAPFKLTRELLEVMDSDAEGTASDAFNYFKVLCIQGFLATRKHAERILQLVEMMQGSGCPCFRGGPKVLQQLRKRFHLGSTEEQCVELVLTLISDSLDAWCTRQYDYYQRVVNGIL